MSIYKEIPQWVREYNDKNYQSSAGKALRIVIDSTKRQDEIFESLVRLAEIVANNNSWILDAMTDLDRLTILKFLEERKQKPKDK